MKLSDFQCYILTRLADGARLTNHYSTEEAPYRPLWGMSSGDIDTKYNHFTTVRYATINSLLKQEMIEEHRRQLLMDAMQGDKQWQTYIIYYQLTPKGQIAAGRITGEAAS